jgi:hypothetical protein
MCERRGPEAAQSHDLGRPTLGQEWAYSLDELATPTGGSA